MRDDADVIAQLAQTNELLNLLAKVAMEPVLTKELQNSKHRRLYELTGAAVPVKALSARLGLGVGTISRIWQRWEDLGLLVKDGQRYRRVLK